MSEEKKKFRFEFNENSTRLCRECDEPSTQNLCGKCALQHSHDFNDSPQPEYPRAASVLESEITALCSDRASLLAVARAASFVEDWSNGTSENYRKMKVALAALSDEVKKEMEK